MQPHRCCSHFIFIFIIQPSLSILPPGIDNFLRLVHSSPTHIITYTLVCMPFVVITCIREFLHRPSDNPRLTKNERRLLGTYLVTLPTIRNDQMQQQRTVYSAPVKQNLYTTTLLNNELTNVLPIFTTQGTILSRVISTPSNQCRKFTND